VFPPAVALTGAIWEDLFNLLFLTNFLPSFLPPAEDPFGVWNPERPHDWGTGFFPVCGPPVPL